LTYLEKMINQGQEPPSSEDVPWNAQGARAQLDHGIQAVRAAQVAVTKFRHKLSSTE
jgi:hypothetical protein